MSDFPDFEIALAALEVGSTMRFGGGYVLERREDVVCRDFVLRNGEGKELMRLQKLPPVRVERKAGSPPPLRSSGESGVPLKLLRAEDAVICPDCGGEVENVFEHSGGCKRRRKAGRSSR